MRAWGDPWDELLDGRSLATEDQEEEGKQSVGLGVEGRGGWPL